jgi:hypothetical protein
MTDFSRYMGIHQYGRAYGVMLENDLHAPGSVDRALWDSAIRLCPETALYLYTAYTPQESSYLAGSRPALEACVVKACVGARSAEEVVEGLARFTAGLALRADRQGSDSMVFGGTEEEIIGRGSDWCTDAARVACALCQVAGVAARLVSVYDLDHAYCGHTIIEAFWGGAWGAVDPLVATCYRHPDGRPASTWDLLTDTRVAWCYRDPDDPAGRAEPRVAAGLVNYHVRDRARYDYTVSRVNDYYRPILAMSERGWPGGLRWLHGEDLG